MNAISVLSTANSLLRTMLGLVVVGVVSVASWFGYSKINAEKQLDDVRKQLKDVAAELKQKTDEIDGLKDDLAASRRKVDQLQTSLHLLKVDHRVAELKVLEQGVDADTGQMNSLIEFSEVNDEGHAIDQPRQFRLQGNKAYVEYWVVKFEDKYVQEADLNRSTSICLFRRIFGEFQTPADGYVLDAVGSRPTAYARGGRMSEFERQIWSDFWELANDPEQARKKGIRAAHGEAPSTELREGRTYRVELRASGGLTISPVKKIGPVKDGQPKITPAA